MSENLHNVYIWMFLVNSPRVLFLAFLKYLLYSHFTQSCIFCTFWRLKILTLWRKIVQNLIMFVYLFCTKNNAIDFTKNFITQEWLVVESCPVPCWIEFLMLYQLVYTLSFQWTNFGLKCLLVLHVRSMFLTLIVDWFYWHWIY